MADIPSIPQQGTRLGNWLTRDQAKELLTVPDRTTLKGKRDVAILALLVGCALRRAELAALAIEDIQQREGRWVIADLRGKGGRIRTVAIPMWVKLLMDNWTTAAGHSAGRLLRPVSKGGRIVGEELSDWAVWSVVEQPPPKPSESSVSAPTICGAPARNSAARTAATSNRSSSCSATPPSKRPNAILVPSRRLPSPSTIIWGCDERVFY
jgi:hypothetical protein